MTRGPLQAGSYRGTYCPRMALNEGGRLADAENRRRRRQTKQSSPPVRELGAKQDRQLDDGCVLTDEAHDRQASRACSQSGHGRAQHPSRNPAASGSTDDTRRPATLARDYGRRWGGLPKLAA